MKHEGSLVAAAETLGVKLDFGRAGRLERYEAILLDRAGGLGMIASGDMSRLRERHTLDALRAAAVFGEGTADVIDLGSGAGLPGIPVAIACPHTRVTLTETRRRRIAFLELVVDELGLTNVAVHGGRVEQAPGPADACMARAFRNAAGSWRVAEPLLRPSGRLVYFAGAGFEPVRDVPEEVALSILPPSPLANSGPLAIMTRQ